MATAAHALRFTCAWQVIALARSGLPLIFAATITVLGGARLVLFTPRILWVRSIAGSVSLVCTFFALTRLPPSHVFTLASTFPLWVALLSWPLYRERPSMQVWLSIAASVSGVVLMELSGPADGVEAGALQRWLAIGSTLVAALTTAIALLGLHQLRHLHPWAVVAHFSGVALLFSLVTFFSGADAPAMPDPPRPETLLLLLAVGTTAAIGQLFLTKAFSAGSPAKVSVVSLTQVVFAMLLDVTLWDHPFSGLTLTGMVLVVAPAGWLMTSREEDKMTKTNHRVTENTEKKKDKTE